MVITWYGQSCFRIQSGDLVLVTDPFSKEIGFTPPRFRGDLVLISHGHHDHANAETIAGEPFVISGAGEYEVKGVYVLGIETFHDRSGGKERGKNTIYRIEFEDLRLLHLGDFGEDKIRDELLDKIGNVDVLMIPIGGKYTIDAEEAAGIVKQIEPRYVIPMHYKLPGLKIALDGPEAFLKETGSGKTEPQEKFVIKKRDIGEEEKTEIILLKQA